MITTNFATLLNNYKAQAIPYLESFFEQKIKEANKESEIPAEVLGQMLDLSVKGKMVRGFLVTLGYEIGGGTNINEIVSASTFIEIAQTGVLIHDDIMDEDELRRGVPTLHTAYRETGLKKYALPSPQRYGESMGICAGDIAFYLSWEKLLSGHFLQENLLRAASFYAQYFTRLAYGQILDISSFLNTVKNEKEILSVYQLKTAEYTGVLPLVLGAILAGEHDKNRLAALKTFGLCLGWIFQIHDDYLGLYGDQQKTGKPNDSDIKEGKQTLLVAHFMSHAKPSDLKTFMYIYGKSDSKKNSVSMVQDLIEKSGSKQHAEDLIQKYFDEAEALLPQISVNQEYTHTLLELLNFVRTREK